MSKLRAIIKTLSVPDFDAKPNVVKRKDGHHITNPEVLTPWEVVLTLESDGPIGRADVDDLLRQFKAGKSVTVEITG